MNGSDVKYRAGARGEEPCSVELMGPERILLISCDEPVIQQFKRLFEPTDSRVIVCPDPVQGREICRLQEPALVISEVDTETWRHLALIRFVATLDAPVTVMLMAAETELDYAMEGVEAGAYDYIQKPIKPRGALLTIGRALQYSSLVSFRREHRQIMEQQVVEKTLEIVRRRDFLKGILDSSTLVSIVLTDLDQNVLFWNTGAENIFGYRYEEMKGKKISKLYPPDVETKQTVERLQDLIRTKTGTVHGKMRQVTKDGRTLSISLALSPMLDDRGEVRGILGVGQDVTEQVRLHEQLLGSLHRIKQTQDASIFCLAKLAESRDEETGLHLDRIQRYCRVLCTRLCKRDKYRPAMTESFVDDLVRSSVLHDIGKVAIPDAILLSPNAFDAREREIMEQHPIHGGRALEEAVRMLGAESFLSIGRDIAYFHHEHWDGSGYPSGLKGNEIPLAARIVSVTDVYDALTTRRRYKKAYSHEEACAVILDGAGKLFDPEIVEVFLEVEKEVHEIRDTFFSAGFTCENFKLCDSDPRSLLTETNAHQRRIEESP